MFNNTPCFDKIKKALSAIIYEKTYLKSNSIEAKIAETLKKMMIGENMKEDDKQVYQIPNDRFYNTLQGIIEAKDNPYDNTDSRFYLSDGTQISKNKISRILVSKFKAKPFRTKEKRGFQINKKDIEKMSKQYEIIDEIKILEELSVEEDNKLQSSDESVTQMTDMTHFKGAIPSISCQNTDTEILCNGV